MTAEKADPRDAELILRLYDLRREAVMREARKDMFTKFHPKSYEDFAAVLKPDQPLNTAYRMVSSYWEMAASFVRHGALHADLFAENCGEGLFMLAKALPYLERLRKEHSPTAFVNMEWVVRNNKEAARRLEITQARLAKMAK